MPRGDKTGPESMGPMTGRRMGFCAGNEQAGYMYSPANGRGLARGFRRGPGRGGGGFVGNQRRFFFERSVNSNSTDEEMIKNEIEILKNQITYLEGKLKSNNN